MRSWARQRGVGEHLDRGAERGDHQVDGVHGLVHDRAAAVEGPGSAPVAGVVVALPAPPGVGGDGRGDGAEVPVPHGLLDLLGGAVEPVLGDDGDGLPGALLGVDDAVGRGQGDVDRLLHDDVLAGVQGRHRAVGVHAAGGADGDGVDVVAAQHRVQVGGGLDAVPVGQLLRPGRVGVDDRDELGEVGQVGQRSCVGPADHAGADEGEPELRRLIRGTHEYAIPSLSRMAVNARVARVKFVAPESAPNSL